MTTHRERQLGQARADLLRRVAEVYTAAVARHQPPTVAVVDELQVPRSTAGRWIRAARAAGMIEVTWVRTSPKLQAVADDLGVTPERLRDSIRRHANGRLAV